MPAAPQFVPMRFGVFLSGDQLFGGRSSLADLAGLLGEVPRSVATAWLSSLCNGYEPGIPESVIEVDRICRQILLAPDLQRRVEEISTRDGGRIAFHRPQLLLGLQLAQRLCPEEPEPSTTAGRITALCRLGEALIRSSDFLDVGRDLSGADWRDAAALLLPLYVESNPPGMLFSMRRIYAMLSDDLWGTDPRLASASQRFRSSIGLSPREYMLVILGRVTKASERRTLGADNALRLSTVFARARAGASIRRAVEALATSYRDLPCSVLDPAEVLRRRPSEPFRSRPLIAMGGDRFWVGDRLFLIDQMLAGVFWALMSTSSRESERLALLQAWGDLFERYMTNRLAPAFRRRYIADPRDINGDQLTDAAVIEKPELVLLEFKAAFIRDSVKYGLEFLPLIAELDSKFLKRGQLARAAMRMLADRPDLLPRGRRRPVFHPVVISLDPAVASPLVAIAMDEKLRSYTLPDAAQADFAQLTVMTADDAELVARFVGAGKKLKNMIRENHAVDPGGGSTFHNYLVGLGESMHVQLPGRSPAEFREPVLAAMEFWEEQGGDELFASI